jgi:HK97 family phage portal protein
MGFTSRQIRSAAGDEAMSRLIDHHMLPGGGAGVSTRTVAGIPAFDAAVAFAAESVAQTTMKVWRGDGPVRQHVTDTWQARLFRGVASATQGWFLFWYIVEASLTARRNAYIWKTKSDTGEVVALTALHPEQVSPVSSGGRIRYGVSFSDNYPRPPEVLGNGGCYVDSATVMHIRGRGGIGEIEAPSPIRQFATSLGVALAKQEHESALYRNGVQGGLVVAFPERVKAEQATAWRDGFDAQHAGASNTATTKIVPGGAEIKQIGMTQVEAQFADSVSLSIADVARITNFPIWFLAASDKGSRPVSPEHEMQRWVHLYFGPRLSRIESAINSDPDLFGAGGDYAGFDTTNMIRGDRMTEANIAIRKVQAGIWLPDEARANDGLNELPGGIGRVVQVTPVGGAPNDSGPPPAPQDDTAGD